MEQKYQGDIDAERESNKRLREQMAELRDDCDILRRALERTQTEVEVLRKSRDNRAVEAPPPPPQQPKQKEVCIQIPRTAALRQSSLPSRKRVEILQCPRAPSRSGTTWEGLLRVVDS